MPIYSYEEKRFELESLREQTKEQTEEIALLETENAELRRDKERLDFIQAFDFEGEYGWKMYRRGTLNCAQFTDCPEWHKSPREAIDAAMAETAGEEPSASLRGD